MQRQHYITNDKQNIFRTQEEAAMCLQEIQDEQLKYGWTSTKNTIMQRNLWQKMVDKMQNVTSWRHVHIYFIQSCSHLYYLARSVPFGK